MRGCGRILALAFSCLSFVACSSSPSSIEEQYSSDLTKVLQAISFNDQSPLDPAESPPASGKLTRDQLDMFIWVKATAMQVAVKHHAENQLLANKQPLENTKTDSVTDGDGNPVLSLEEHQVLERLKCSEVLYIWVKDTVAVTTSFLDTVDKPDVIELVKEHDPAIKNNIALVKGAADSLEIVNRYPIEKFHTPARPANT